MLLWYGRDQLWSIYLYGFIPVRRLRDASLRPDAFLGRRLHVG
jgi:hypothetical protein